MKVERFVVVQNGVIGLVEIPVIVVLAATGGGVAGTDTGHIVVVEILLPGIFIVPAAAELEAEGTGEIDGEGLRHIELVGLVVAVECVVVHQHVTVGVAADTHEPFTVGVLHAEGRRHGEYAAEVVLGRVAVLDRRPLRAGVVERGCRSQPGTDLVVAVEHERKTLVVVAVSITVRIVVAQRCVVVSLVVAALEVDTVILREGR